MQGIARARLADAALLYENKRYSSSYYLYGYAVEAALKACISVLFSADAIPDKNLVNRVYTRDLKVLLSIAGLTPELKKSADRKPRD